MKHDSDMNLGLKNIWNIKCFDSEGNLKWDVTKKNLVVTEGLNHVLSSTFDGATQITAWYVGLKNTGSVAAVTGIKFQFASGNILEGSFTMYGMAKA